MRTFGLALILFINLLPVMPAAETNSRDPREIVRRAVELDKANTEKSLQYTFREQREERDLDKQGEVKSSRSKTFDVTLLEGSEYRRLIARDGKPLPPEEESKEQRKLEKSIEKARQETPEQRSKRLADREKKNAKNREFAEEIPDAFDFQLLGEERVADVDTWVISADPREAYEPRDRRTKFLKKLRGKLWISKSDYGWVKVETETIDNVSFGWLLARLNKGAVLEFEQKHVNNEVWLLNTLRIRIKARLALVKGFHREIISLFSDYRKFSADSRILSVETPQ